MWFLVNQQRFDEQPGRAGWARETYAAQLGSIGCLVFVDTILGSTRTTSAPVFVPGVKIQAKDGKYFLYPMEGYGVVPDSDA